MEVVKKLASQKCSVCFRPAYSNNYKVLSCDACKMFFRRIATEKIVYSCLLKGQCFADYTELTLLPKCKSCRYQRCLNLGMDFEMRNIKMRKKRIPRAPKTQFDYLASLMSNLLGKNEARVTMITTQFTDKDPTLEDLVERRDLEVFVRQPDHIMRPQDSSFFGLYTTVTFLLSLDFMQELSNRDQIILLKRFVGKASLFANAMRAYRANRDRLVTVDGNDVYPERIKLLVAQSTPDSTDFLNRIRSQLVAKLIELKMTTEEFVLINAVLFCTPLPALSDEGKNIIGQQQSKYNSALFHYCQVNYPSSAPSRYVELLSVSHVMEKNYYDVQYLTMVFKLMFKDVKYKKLVVEVI